MSKSTWFVALSLCFLSSLALGQSTSGTLTGRISDPSGAIVLGAKVEVRDLGSNRVIPTEASNAGQYTVPDLPPGFYEIKVSFTGFKSAVASNVEVRTAQTTTQNFTLQVGQSTESVSVSSEAALINPDSAAVSTTISRALIQDLPFFERSALSVALLTPGAQGDPQYNGGVQGEMPGIYTQAITPGGSITVGGGRPGGGSILVDGSDIMSAGNAKAVISFSADTIQEVVVQANGIPAQYGRTTGGIVNQATKSGTNEFHGVFTWTHLEPGLETRFLGSSFDPTARYNSASGAIGGPVVIPKIYNGRNKTFFWASGEPQRQKLQIGASRARLPTVDELAGRFANEWDFLDPTLRAKNIDAALASSVRTNTLYYHYAINPGGFPTGAQLPVAQWNSIPGSDLTKQLAANPLAQSILKTLFPFTPGKDTPFIHWLRPDGYPDIDGNNAIYVRSVQSQDNRYSMKFDHLLSSKDRLAFRYTTVPITGVRYDWGGPSDYGDPIVQDRITSYNSGLTYSRIFTPTLTNETRFTYSRSDAFRGPNDAASSKDWGSALGLLPAVAGSGFPQILGRGASGEGRTLDVNLGIGTDFSWIRGAHSFKVGGDFRHIELDRISYAGLTGGAYSFSGQVTPPTGALNDLASQIAGLILGSLNTYTYQKSQSNDYYRWQYAALFFQDDWKLSPKITVNLGVRWDVETPRTEKYDRQGWFDPTVAGSVNGKAVTGAFVWAGQDGRQRGLWPTNYKGFQPRIGIAYAAKPWLVWRSSFSMLRAPITGYGNAIYPDTNVAGAVINSAQGIGGKTPGAAINFITNPLAPLPAVTPLARMPIFYMNDINSFTFSYIPQNSAMPTVYRWNAGFQISLWKDTAIDISYDGSKGTHLYSQPWPINAAPYSATAPLVRAGADFTTPSTANNPLQLTNSNGSVITGTLINTLRAYPNWFNRLINADYDRSGNSSYNALNIGLQKRFTGGLFLLLGYSWSKSLDDGAPGGNDIFGVTNLQVPHREKSYSEFDMPTKIRASFNYEMPFGRGKMLLRNANGLLDRIVGGFNLSGTITHQTGYPGIVYLGSAGWFQSVTAGSGVDGFSIRPSVLPGVPLINPNWRNNPFTTNYYNPSAFVIPGSPSDPQTGNLPRTLNDGRSPNTSTFDASMSKNIKIAREGKVYLQLRADAFNVFNHPVLFVNPNGRNNGLFTYVASSRSFVPNLATTPIDPNNTGQYGNYAGRAFRLGAKFVF